MNVKHAMTAAAISSNTVCHLCITILSSLSLFSYDSFGCFLYLSLPPTPIIMQN